MRIAALKLDEALAYLHWHAPDFVIETVQNLGLILVVSGRPSIDSLHRECASLMGLASSPLRVLRAWS